MKLPTPLLLYIVFVFLLVLGVISVGVIKLMAWWQIAMNGCGQ